MFCQTKPDETNANVALQSLLYPEFPVSPNTNANFSNWYPYYFIRHISAHIGCLLKVRTTTVVPDTIA